MKRSTLAALAAITLLSGCDGDSASDPVAVEAADTTTDGDDGDATASLAPQSALDAASGAGVSAANDRWSWVEAPDKQVTLPEGVQVLKESTDNFDLFNKQFIAEELVVACQRLDEDSVGNVIYGQGFNDWDHEYASLITVAAAVSCPEHQARIRRWGDV